MTNAERQSYLLRHSITAERRRQKFRTEFNVLTNVMCRSLLMYSQTGDEQYIINFTKLLSYDFNKMWVEFIKQEGFVD